MNAWMAARRGSCFIFMLSNQSLLHQFPIIKVMNVKYAVLCVTCVCLNVEKDPNILLCAGIFFIFEKARRSQRAPFELCNKDKEYKFLMLMQ